MLALSLMLVSAPPATAADDSRLNEATRQVENGARRAGEGIADAAKGIGNTVVEGAKVAAEKLNEAGKAAEPQARSAWQQVKDGASAFGQGVRSFFARLAGG
jgi:hypothetical protein